MGRIGQRVSARLKPFNAHTSYIYYRRLSTTEEQILGTRNYQLRPIAENSDMVSPIFRLTPATQEVFDRELLYKMTQGAYLVNTARGRIVGTEALIEVMESGP